MSKAKLEFEKLCEEHGIQLSYGRSYTRKHDGITYPYWILLDAPEGKNFASSECSSDGSIQGTDENPKVNWTIALKALKEIIELGFEDADEESE